MKVLARILVAAGLLVACGPAFAGFEGEEHTYASLLLSDSDADIKVAAKALARNQSKPTGITDLAAEALWQSCQGKRVLDPDTQAWLAIALGASKKARYRSILKQCLDAQPDPKVVKHAEQALQDLPDDKSPQMRGGAWDLGPVAAQLAEAVKRDAARRKPGQLAAVPEKISMTAAYALMGLPDLVMAGSVQTASAQIGARRKNYVTSGIIAGYPDGVLVFTLDTGEGGEWKLHARHTAGRIDDSVPVRVAMMRHLLSTEDWAELTATAKGLLSPPEKDRAVLDEVARRIAAGQAIDDSWMADALSWLCSVLAESGDGRYRAFLMDVSQSAVRHRLRTHAEDAAEKLPEGIEPAFDPRQPRAVAKAAPRVVTLAPAVAAETPAIPASAPAAMSSAPAARGAGFAAGATVSLKAGAVLRIRASVDAEPAGAEGRSVVLKIAKRDPGGTWWYASAGEKSGWVLESELEVPSR